MNNTETNRVSRLPCVFLLPESAFNVVVCLIKVLYLVLVSLPAINAHLRSVNVGKTEYCLIVKMQKYHSKLNGSDDSNQHIFFI